jgi:ABC-type amino acid transport substrate-binding protein
METMNTRWLAVLAGLLLLTLPIDAETLRLGIGTSPGSSYPPYEELAKNGAYSGLSIDILNAIVRKTGDRIVAVYLPGPRLFAGISNGTIDIDIFANPAWRPQYAADSIYTEPYLTTRMILVYRNDLADTPKSLKDLAGRRLLTVNGFRYPGLDDRFERGEVIRDVAPSTALLLKMLQVNHGSLGVSDEAVFLDISRREHYDALAPGFPVAPPSEVMMRFPKRLASVVERFNHAITELQTSGELTQILAKYGLKP